MNDHPSSFGPSPVESLPAKSVLTPTARCSFCGLGEGEVARLFQGQAGYICDECVEVCLTLLADYRALGLAPPEPKRSWYQRWFGEEETVACRVSGSSPAPAFRSANNASALAPRSNTTMGWRRGSKRSFEASLRPLQLLFMIHHEQTRTGCCPALNK